MRLLVALGAMAVVAYMSLKSSYPAAVQRLFDNLGSGVLHFLAYGGLALIYFWAFLRKQDRGPLWAAIFSISYGLALEIAQLWVPGRSFSVVDLAVNCAGAVLAAVAVRERGGKKVREWKSHIKI